MITIFPTLQNVNFSYFLYTELVEEYLLSNYDTNLFLRIGLH